MGVTPLMMTYVLGCLPAPMYPSLVCSAGTSGYHAFKEMLQSGGHPGVFVLLESENLSEVEPRFSEVPSKPALLRICTADTIQLYSSYNQPELQTICGIMETIHLLSNASTMEFNFYNLPNLVTASFDMRQLSALPGAFLGGCTSLISLTFNHFPLMVELPTNFLTGCSALSAVDLDPFSFVAHLPIPSESFLFRCTSLKTVDLSPLSALRELPRNFLMGCNGLKSIDLAPLSNVTTINSHFLSECTALTSINLSPLSQVTEISNYFLNKCTGLKSIDLTPMSRITKIGMWFLSNCTGLVSVNLGPMTHLTDIGPNFMSNCTGLTDPTSCVVAVVKRCSISSV